jgi:hypothetical protein
MAEQQSLLPWEEKFISGQMSPEELRERLGGGSANRVHELAAQYGQAGEDGEFSLDQFTPGIMEHISGQGTTQGTQRMDKFDADTSASDDDNAFTAAGKWFGRNIGAPVVKTGLAIGDKISDTHGAFNKREGKLGLGMGEGTENAAFGALGAFMPGAGKGAGVAAKANPGAIAKGLNALKNTFSKSAPKTGPSGAAAAKAASAAKTPAASGAVPAAGKAFDDPAAKAAAAKSATATEAEAAKVVAAKTATKEGAEEVAKKGGKEVAEEVAKKPSLLSRVTPSKKTLAAGLTGASVAPIIGMMGDDEEKPPEATAEEHPDYQEETPGTVTTPIPMAPGAAAPAAPGAAPGVVVPGSPPAHNVAREQQLEHAERLKKLGRLPPRPIQDSHRTKAHGRAWEEEVKKRGDRLDEEDVITGANSDRMKAIYDSTGGRSEGAWDALGKSSADGIEKQKQAYRNFNLNQGNARDRRGKLDNIMKEATNRWIDGGMKGPQPSAGFVEPEVMGRQNFDKEGFHIPHVGTPAPDAQPFFDQDRGGMTPEAFTDLTGLGRKGTGVSQNADGSWNSIESDGAFDRAGGMDSAKDYLIGNEPQDSGVTPQDSGIQDGLPPQDPFPQDDSAWSPGDTDDDMSSPTFPKSTVGIFKPPPPSPTHESITEGLRSDPNRVNTPDPLLANGQPQDYGQDSQSTIPGGSPAPVDQPPAQPSTIPAPPQDNFELPTWDGVSPLPNSAATDSSAVGWNPGGNMSPGQEQDLKGQMQTAEKEDLLNQGSPVEGLPDPGAQTGPSNDQGARGQNYEPNLTGRDPREEYLQGPHVEGAPDPGAQPEVEGYPSDVYDVIGNEPGGPHPSQADQAGPYIHGSGQPDREAIGGSIQDQHDALKAKISNYAKGESDWYQNWQDENQVPRSAVETGEMSSPNEVAPTQAPEELTAPSLSGYPGEAQRAAPSTAGYFPSSGGQGGVHTPSGGLLSGAQTPQAPQAPQTPPHANNYPPFPGVEHGDAMYASLENFGPGSGESQDHPSGVGRYTDQFGQQSKLNKGTVRLSANDQEYGDANFQSKADALGMVNRRKSFDQPTPEPQPQPHTPPVPPAVPMSPTPPPAGVPAPKMPGPGALMVTAAALALAKKMGINPQAAAKILNRGKTAIGVKSAQATKALPGKVPTPGPAVSSPGTRIPPGQPVRTAAPGGGTPAGPRVITPKTPAPVRTPSAPQQQYVPRTGFPATKVPTSRLPGGAPAPRRRFDSPDELLKQRQFALN